MLDLHLVPFEKPGELLGRHGTTEIVALCFIAVNPLRSSNSLALSTPSSKFLQDRTSICCLEFGKPSQKIEFVFSASPETMRRGLGSRLRRPGGHLQDLAACPSMNLDVFALPLLRKVFQATAWRPCSRQIRSPVVCARPPAYESPFSWPPQGWRAPCFLSAVPCREQEPVHESGDRPAWPLPPAPAGYACFPAWKWEFLSSCRRSSSLRCTTRSN